MATQPGAPQRHALPACAQVNQESHPLTASSPVSSTSEPVSSTTKPVSSGPTSSGPVSSTPTSPDQMASNLSSSSVSWRLRLDPRAKLYLLLLANLVMFFHVSTRAEALLVCLVIIPLLAAGRVRIGVRLAALYAALLAIGLWAGTAALDGVGTIGTSTPANASATVPATVSTATEAAPSAAVSSGTISVSQQVGDTAHMILHFIGLCCVGLRMMMPCFITGAYAFTTTSVSEFVCALRRMRIPEAFVIPCMVVIRFFPTIFSDYRRIRDAMALRGLAFGRMALLRHPAQSLEFVLVPLLMNATIVSRDLSVAALTKGLGLRGTHTCRTEIRMHWFDWIIMAICTVPLALGIGGVL